MTDSAHPVFWFGTGEIEFDINGIRYIYYTELWMQKKIKQMAKYSNRGFRVINFLKKRKVKYVKIGE